MDRIWPYYNVGANAYRCGNWKIYIQVQLFPVDGSYCRLRYKPFRSGVFKLSVTNQPAGCVVCNSLSIGDVPEGAYTANPYSNGSINRFLAVFRNTQSSLLPKKENL